MIELVALLALLGALAGIFRAIDRRQLPDQVDLGQLYSEWIFRQHSRRPAPPTGTVRLVKRQPQRGQWVSRAG